MQIRYAGAERTIYQYTGQEYDGQIGLHNFRARYYDSGIGRFYVIDPQGQFASPYNGMGNNPVMMVDPDGELAWFVPIIVGAVVNTMVQGVAGNIDNFGDLALSMGIGALSGAAGFGAGQLVSGALGASSTLGGSVINGALTGAAGGFAGGFVGGAGNAWAGGASLEEGLESGFKTGEYGAITGAAIGGISGGIRHNKQMLTFRKGNAELGIQSDEAVPATDDFLNDARKAWFPDKSMDNIKRKLM